MKDLPNFATKDELFEYLITNKDDLMYQKKSVTKFEDSICYDFIVEQPQFKVGDTSKAAMEPDATEIKVRAIINTTNFMDSHKDVHIPGIWNRSLKNNKRIKMLQEHQMKFDKIIADKDDLAVSVKEYEWKELGYDVEGKTQALVFDATVKESRNPFMFNEYKNLNVDNHSVGMRYVQMKMAINSDKDDYKNEKENWDKYYPDIANKKEADNAGYFWAVLEAKAIEGSAVPIGSNTMTPTLARAKAHQEQEQTQPDAMSLEQKEINKFFNNEN